MMTRTISVIAGNSVTLPTNSPNILAIEGYCNGVQNTQYFLQLHSAVPVTGVTAPLRSWQILGLDGFTFNERDIGLLIANMTNPPGQGTFYLYLSSTDAVFTATLANCDINVDIEEFELELGGTTTATATDQTYFEVFADNVTNATKKLISFTVQPTTFDVYVQLFANDPGANAVPIQQFTVPGVSTGLAPNGVITTFKMGIGGRSVFQQDANGTPHYGAVIAVSRTSGSWDAATGAAFTGVYK